MATGKVLYKVGFRLEGDDLAQQMRAPLQAIQTDLDKINKAARRGMSEAMAEGVKQASILETTLKRAATDKGTSFQQMNKALSQAGSSVQQMVAGLSGAGMNNSLNAFLTTFTQADRHIVTMSSRMKEFQRILAQSVRYSIAQDFQRFVIGQIQSAVYYVQGLNRSITEIGVVAPEVAHRLDSIADSIIRNSRELRVTAREYAEASVIFWQQGLTEDEVNRRTEITVMAAKASGQTMKEMSEQLTAVWNTYRMAGDEMIRAASVAAQLGADTAAEFQDIAVGMQIAAAGASMLGVEFDSLAAIMATVRETTLMSASVIGNAFKTIFARLSNLRAGGIEDGVDLGQITTQLNELGVSVLDQTGNLRDLDDIIMQLGMTWDNYSRNQQIAIAQVIGGVRQYQHFLALMQNFDKYLGNLETANMVIDGSELIRQYETFLGGIQSAIENKGEAWQRAFSQLFATEHQLVFYRTLEAIGIQVENLIAGFGALPGILLYIGAILGSKLGPLLGGIGVHLKELYYNILPGQDAKRITKVLEEAKEKAKAAAIQTAKITGKFNQGMSGNHEGVTLEDEQRAIERKIELTERLKLENVEIQKQMVKASENEKLMLQQKLKNNEALMQRGAELYDILTTQQKIIRAQDSEVDKQISAVRQQQEEEVSPELLQILEEEIAKRDKIQQKITKADTIRQQQIATEKEMMQLAQEQVQSKQYFAEKQKEAFDELRERSFLEIENHERKLMENEQELAHMQMVGSLEEEDLIREQLLIEKVAAQKSQLEIIREIRQNNIKEQEKAVLLADLEVRAAEGNLTVAQQKSVEMRNHIRVADQAIDVFTNQLRIQQRIVDQTDAQVNGETDRSIALRQSKSLLETISKLSEGALKGLTGHDALDMVQGDLQEILNGLKLIQDESVDGIVTEFEALLQSGEELHEIFPKIVKAVESVNETVGNTGKEIKEINLQVQKLGAETVEALENNTAIMEKAAQSKGPVIEGFKGWASAIGQVTGAVTLLGNGLGTLIDDIVTGDITIGGMISTIMKLIPGVVMLVSVMGKYNRTLEKNALAQQKVAKATIKKLKAKVLDGTATKKQIKLYNAATKAVAKKAVSFKLLGIAAFKVTIPLLLLKVILIALLAAFIAVIAIFKIWNASQERAAAASRAAAKHTMELAEASRTLGKELQGLAATTRDLAEAFDSLSTDEQVREFQALLDKANELNRANPELNLVFTGGMNAADIAAFADEIERASEASLQTSQDQARQAMELQNAGIRRGSNRGGAGTRNLDRGLSGSETRAVTTAIGNLSPEAQAALNAPDGRNVVDQTELARHFQDIIDQMMAAGEHAAAAAFTKEMMENSEGFAELREMVEAYDEASAAITRRNDAIAALGDDHGQAHFENVREATNQLNDELQKRQTIEEELRIAQDIAAASNTRANRAAVAEIEQRLAAQELVVIQHRAEVAGLNDISQAMRELGGEAGETAGRIQVALQMLDGMHNRNLFSDEEWQAMEEAAIQAAIDNNMHLIGSLDPVLDGYYRLKGIMSQVNDIFADFDPDASNVEQMSWLRSANQDIEIFNEQLEQLGLGDYGIDAINQDFLLMSRAQQEAYIRSRELRQAQLEHKIITESQARYVNLHTEALERQAQVEINLAAAQAALAAARAGGDPAEIAAATIHLNEVMAAQADAIIMVENAYNNMNDAQLKAQLGAQDFEEVLRSVREEIQNFNREGLGETLRDQADGLDMLNDRIRFLNENIAGLHIAELGREFLLLNDYQQDVILTGIEWQANISATNTAINSLRGEMSELAPRLQELQRQRLDMEVGMDTSEIDREIAEIQRKIDDLDLEINITIDEAARIEIERINQVGERLMQTMEHLGDVNRNILDTEGGWKNLGGTFELTAAQAREIANVFPEMLRHATVTYDGMVHLNEDYVNQFIAGKEHQLAQAVVAEVHMLELMIGRLEGQQMILQGELKMLDAYYNHRFGAAEADLDDTLKLWNEGWNLRVEGEQQTALYEAKIMDQKLENAAQGIFHMCDLFHDLQDEVAGVAEANYENLATALEASSQETHRQTMYQRTEWMAMVPVLRRVRSWIINLFNRDRGGEEGSDVGGAPPPSSIAPITTNIAERGGDVRDFDELSAIMGEMFADTSQEGLRREQLSRVFQMGQIDAQIGNIRARQAELLNSAAGNLVSWTGNPQRVLEHGGLGGSASGGSTTEPGDPRYIDPRILDDLYKRFADIDRILSSISDHLTVIDRQIDQAFGTQKWALMQRRGQLLQEQARAYEQMAQQAQVYMSLDMARINAAGAHAGFSANFDPDNMHMLMNENEIRAALQAYRDAAAARLEIERMIHNDLATRELQDENQEHLQGFKDALQAAEDFVSETLDAISDFDAARERHLNAIEQAVHRVNEWIRNEINIIEARIELRISINARDIRMIEMTLSRLGSSFNTQVGDGLNTIATRMMDNANDMITGHREIVDLMNSFDPSNTEHAARYIAEFGQLAMDTFLETGHHTQDVMDALGRSADQMLSWVEEMYALNDRMLQRYQEALSRYIAQFDSLISTFDGRRSMVDAWMNIWETSGQHWRNQRLSIDLLNTSIDTMGHRVQGVYQKYQFLNGELANAEKLHREAIATYGADSIEAERFHDTVLQIRNDIMQARVDMQQGVSEMINMIADAAQRTAEIIKREITASLGGVFAELDQAMTMFNQHRDMTSWFMHPEDVEFELNQLLRNVEEQMSHAADGSELWEKWADWVSKINDLQEDGTEMTQRQLDILKAEFDLAVAKAAWEESQNAKNTMRLARDASGNWSYVFSADDAGQDGADEADIERRIHNIRRMNREAAEEAEERWFQTYIRMMEFEANIDQARYEYDEAYRRMVHARRDMFLQQLEQYERTMLHHHEVLDKSFEETTLHFITGKESMEEVVEHYLAAHTEMVVALRENYENMQYQVDNALKLIGMSYDTLEKNIKENMESVRQENEDTSEAIRQLREQASANMAALVAEIMAWMARWREEIRQTIDEIMRLIQAMQKLKHEQAGTAQHERNVAALDALTGFGARAQFLNETVTQDQGRGGMWNGQLNTDIGSATEWGMRRDEDLQELAREAAPALGAAIGRTVTENDVAAFLQAGGITLVGDTWKRWDSSVGSRVVMPGFDVVDSFGRFMAANEEDRYSARFARGGLANFTGPAWLDGSRTRPELVLNPEDTQNMLSAVSIMRDSINRHLRNLGSAQMSRLNKDETPTPIDQQVHITADFPNVTDSSEIQDAFNNLINEAAQYRIQPRV